MIYIAFFGAVMMVLSVVNMLASLFSSSLLDLEGLDDSGEFAISLVAFFMGLGMVLFSAEVVLP